MFVNETVVIVEDDVDILEVLTLYVDNAGFQTYAATTFQDGKQLILDKRPDIIVLDINLPDG